MKKLTITTAAFILLFGTVASRGANVDRISAATGVPVQTLQAERASTGLGWGGIEKAHLLANATGQSFDNIVALHQSGQGWGKIAHDNGQNLGRLVSNANRSSRATAHAQNLNTVMERAVMFMVRATVVHGKSATNLGRGHSNRMTTARGSIADRALDLPIPVPMGCMEWGYAIRVEWVMAVVAGKNR